MSKLTRFLSSYSILGLVRFLRLRMTGKELLVTGMCQCCGNCCRKINLEGARGWLRSQWDFEAMVRDYPEYRRFQITGTDSQGFLQFSCSWLGGDGLCQDHSHRLPLCRNFPDKTLHFCGGVLPPGCGYRISEVRPFARYLSDEIQKKDGNETYPHP